MKRECDEVFLLSSRESISNISRTSRYVSHEMQVAEEIRILVKSGKSHRPHCMHVLSAIQMNAR